MVEPYSPPSPVPDDAPPMPFGMAVPSSGFAPAPGYGSPYVVGDVPYAPWPPKAYEPPGWKPAPLYTPPEQQPVQGYASVRYAQPAYVDEAVPQYALVSLGGRFGAAVLDVAIMLCTLLVGYWIWSLIAWNRGQTPAKQLLGHVVVDRDTGLPFSWGRMFVRQFCVQGVLALLINQFSFGIYPLLDACMIFNGTERATLHDRIVGSAVAYRTV